MGKVISGIQQIGIGVRDAQEASAWYRRHFGMDIKVFEDSATASLMTRYTGGNEHQRTAILSLNMKGGGGFEIWQFTSRDPQPAPFNVKLGDLGINAAKIKCADVEATYRIFKEKGLDLVTPLEKNPVGEYNFLMRDPYGNLFHVVPGHEWFNTNTGYKTGGICGAVIGSTNIDESRRLYSDVLGYDEVIFEECGTFADFKGAGGSEHQFRRVLLRHSEDRKGGFSNLFGPTEIELIQVLNREPNKLYKNRYWGDLGFIHLCFDVQGMDALGRDLSEQDFPFTVDSADSFDMGEAAGRFTYVEDPDGTLIEFVETHKVPIIKKIGWYIDMTKRDPEKSLPNWMIKALRFSRVKD